MLFLRLNYWVSSGIRFTVSELYISHNFPCAFEYLMKFLILSCWVLWHCPLSLIYYLNYSEFILLRIRPMLKSVHEFVLDSGSKDMDNLLNRHQLLKVNCVILILELS